MDTGQSTAAAPPAPRPSPALRELAWGTSAALVSVLAAAWRVGAPASLGGLWGHWDYTTVYALARTFAGGGWIGPNEDLGYPFVQDPAGFPSPDFVHLTALKALAVATGDPTIATNLFILLSFAAVAAAGYALLRVVRSPAPLAFALAVSLALVPWHFDRFQHVFLANYSSALLGLILVVAVLSWNLALSGPDRGRPRHLLIGLALACYVGLAGAYYAVFITILALVTLTFQVLLGRRGRALIPAAWLGLLPLVITQMAAYSYRLIAVTDAASGDAFARTPAESQMYAGAFFTLLRTAAPWSSALPIPGLSLIETATSPIEADAGNSTVGLIAVISALVICGLLLLANGSTTRRQFVEAAGYWPWLFMTSILFFIVSGFGQVFAVFFLFQIRSWGRFAIIVIAIAYVILGIAVTYRLSRSHRRTMLQAVSVTIVLLLTVADLVSMPAPFDADRAAAEADELREYGSQLDAALAPGCGIYELPVYSFPEGMPEDGTATYDPLLPYLFSARARWSYGGIKGTQAGDWHVTSVSRDPATLTQQAKAAGFCAIQVDSQAEGADVFADLATTLGDPVATSTSGRWRTYSLADATTGPYTRDYILEPALVSHGFGFSDRGLTSATVSAEMGGTDASLFVTNPGDVDLVGHVVFTVTGPPCPTPVELTASGQGQEVAVPVGDAVSEVQVPFTAPSGELGVVHLAVATPCQVGESTRIEVANPRFVPGEG